MKNVKIGDNILCTADIVYCGDVICNKGKLYKIENICYNKDFNLNMYYLKDIKMVCFAIETTESFSLLKLRKIKLNFINSLKLMIREIRLRKILELI